MADLRTRYLGLDLRTPLVASASPLTGTRDGLRRLEAAGADVAMMTSALLPHGPGHVPVVEAGLRDWLAGHGHQSVGQVRGQRSQAR